MTFSKCPISNRSSNFFAEHQPPIFAVFVLGPKVRYENEQLLVDLKIEQPEKTDVREDDLSWVTVRSTGGHSKRR